jgi:hypothetical protein
MINETPIIKCCTWKNVHLQVALANPQLADIINRIAPDDTYQVLVARYPYGNFVFQHNDFYLPQDPRKIQQGKFSINNFLGESTIPVGVLLSYSAESFTVLDNHRVIPFLFYKKGAIIGIYENFIPTVNPHQYQIFSMTAGARSVYMLPKITDLVSHKRLQSVLQIHSNPPKTLLEQWALFSELAAAQDSVSQWTTEILFFSQQWTAKIKHDSAWSELRAFLLYEAWNNPMLAQNQFQLNFLFNQFIAYTEKKNLRIFPHYLEVLKHLITIALGLAPAFVPAIDNTAGPFEYIQKVYLNHYGLKEYIPTLMHLDYFNCEQKNHTVYYSLNYPALLDSLPKPKTPVNNMTELEELQKLMVCFFDFLGNDSYYLEKSILASLKKISFRFFHNMQSYNKEVKPSEKMAEFDPNLLFMPGGYQTCNKKFSDASQFVRGCVSISLY